MKKVAIIGSGISGLSAAYELKKKMEEGEDLDYVLLEASDSLGGVIVTEKVDGFLIEGGPDSFVSTKPQTIELASELGIGDELLNSSEENKGTFILSGGTVHRLPEGIMTMVPTKIEPFLKTKLISWPGKLRAAMDLVIPPKRNGEEESLAQFVKRRLGTEILDKIAEPLVAGIHASDPDRMSLKSTFPQFIRMEQDHGSLIKGSLALMKKAEEAKAKAQPGAEQRPKRTFFMSFKGGMQELTDTLASKLDREKLLTNRKVLKITHDGKKSCYEIGLGRQGSIFADAVIIAAPAHAAAHMLAEVDQTLAEKLEEIPYVDSATISLGFKNESLGGRPLVGFGVIIPLAEKRKLMAATWCSNKWAYRAPQGSFLVRGFVGGAKNQEYVNMDDESLIKLVRDELADLIGVTGEPQVARVFRWRKGLAQYTIGHAERVTMIENRVASYPGLFLAGSAYKGVGISDCIRTGQEAAKAACK